MSVQLARRWLALAEQRRDNFVELYETGRWRRYYTEEQFVERMRQAIDLVNAWKRHAGLEREPFRLEQFAAPPRRLDGTIKFATVDRFPVTPVIKELPSSASRAPRPNGAAAVAGLRR